MDISFIIPFYNESDFLRRTLLSIDDQVLDNIRAEVFLVDGMSTDGSEEIATEFAKNNSNDKIRFIVLKNIDKKTPYAFNLGIEKANGEIIGFGGAHTIYPEDYFYNSVNLFNEIDAAVIGGGHTNYLPDNDTIIANAMACLYKSPIGSGVAKYHRLNKPAYVDTVYGGFYKKEIFIDIGTFNTSLTKNQDNELNTRVISAGYKIYFHPILSTDYVQKTNLKLYINRAYSFGRYHFETWKANYQSIRLRHLIPGFFCIYLLLIIFLLLLSVTNILIMIPLIIYFILILINGIYFIFSVGIRIGLLTIPIFILYHICYGVGVILGLFFCIGNENKK